MKARPKKRTALKIVIAGVCFIVLIALYYQFLYRPTEVNGGIFILSKTLTGHTSDVWAAKFSPAGELFASGSVDSSARLYNKEGNLLKIIRQPQGITNVQFSPDGKYIATASYDGKLRLWTINGDLTREFYYGGTVWTVEFSPDGKMIAGAGEDKNIKLWNAATGELTATLRGHQANIWSVKFSRDGNKLISGSFDKTIKIWNVHTQALLNTLTAHTQAIVDLATSPDGKTFASASDDKTIKLWDINNGNLLYSMQGGEEHVQGLAYSPDGNWLVSSGRDKAMPGEFLQNIFGDSYFNKGVSMRLWNLKTHKVIQTFRQHANDVNDVAFSTDGNYIISASSDKTVCLWKLKRMK